MWAVMFVWHVRSGGGEAERSVESGALTVAPSTEYLPKSSTRHHPHPFPRVTQKWTPDALKATMLYKLSNPRYSSTMAWVSPDTTLSRVRPPPPVQRPES